MANIQETVTVQCEDASLGRSGPLTLSLMEDGTVEWDSHGLNYPSVPAHTFPRSRR